MNDCMAERKAARLRRYQGSLQRIIIDDTVRQLEGFLADHPELAGEAHQSKLFDSLAVSLVNANVCGKEHGEKSLGRFLVRLCLYCAARGMKLGRAWQDALILLEECPPNG